MSAASPQRETVTVGGRELVLETGRMARQADGACVVRCGDTAVLVTAVGEAAPRPGMGFFPLTVEYRESYAAAGRVPPVYGRREGRPGDHEILASRVIDRSIRPLFPDGYRSEVQVLVTVLSAEPDVEPGALALVGASAALHLSDIPWAGPVAGARFAGRAGALAAFPSVAERRGAELDLVVSLGPRGLVMVEGQAAEVPEDEIVRALVDAQRELAALLAAQERLRAAAGRSKRAFTAPALPADVLAAAAPWRGELRAAFQTAEKRARRDAVRAAEERARTSLQERFPESSEAVAAVLEALRHDEARALILDGRRMDGRGAEDVRPITIEAGLLARTHGSALFTRGETQALATATLGTGGDVLRRADLFGDHRERFFLHYNFPPFSVGETRPVRGPGRREVGHGMLAERALRAVLPDEDEFPYTLRVVSDILESNGSSSMATVCAGCLALLDAGVPLKKSVAGVAMGLVEEGERVAVLTDILGDEDHLGDMDFKVCGTADGVTALQMDIKMEGLTEALLASALEQARRGREHVLAEMAKSLAAPRPELSKHAPRLMSIRIRPERIRDVIGPGGSVIRSIIEETGATVDVGEDGLVRVASSDLQGARDALRRIELLTAEAEVGAVYAAVARTVRDQVAFVELFPGTEGVLHISEVAPQRIDRVGDVVRAGEVVNVRVLGVDPKGRIRVSRKAALDADPTEVRGGPAAR
jgi:polyribonucleotide nucleotidyltransferase